MPLKYTIDFEVRPDPNSVNLLFPMDMLRYDCCFPATGEDASRLLWAIRHHGIMELTLRCYSPYAYQGWNLGDPIPKFENRCPVTIERWMSFGWTVTKIHSSRKIL